MPLDIPTLRFVAICLAALLGACLLLAWLLHREAKPLGLWGAGYAAASAAMALWGERLDLLRIPPEAAIALMLLACGVGAAFIVLLTVKEQHVDMYRNAASTDHLTGLANRRAFFERARALCQARGLKDAPVALLMFDLDHFKSINDRFGHAAGDDALRVFAAVARNNMRSEDIIGRLGGEEFAAIVPGGIEIAQKIGERLRTAFAAAGVTIAGQAMNATVSIGAASGQGVDLSVDELIATADQALYRAKHAGRNRLECARMLPRVAAAEVPLAPMLEPVPAHARRG